MSAADLNASIPLFILGGAAIVAMLLGTARNGARPAAWLSLAGVVAAGISAAWMAQWPMAAFGGMVSIGGFSSFCAVVFCGGAALTILLARSYLEKEKQEHAEFYALLLFATVGMLLMASALDLIVVFVGLELMSISFYALAGFFRALAGSNESSLKYFLLGAFATGFFLYGVALIYGTTGSTQFGPIAAAIAGGVRAAPVFWVGIGLLAVGFAFKVAAVPFHMWVPDVYEGAPTVVAGFMSTAGKAAAFSALLLVSARMFALPADRLRIAVGAVAAASMLFGNLVAVAQTSIKRMLAYSSIAHAGYMLVGIASQSTLGYTGLLFYLGAYTLMQIGAFGVVSILENEEGKAITLADLSGLSSRSPGLAALMAIFMFSLAGIPPFGGFFGKYYLFAAAINSNMLWLALVGIAGSLVSIYFYLGVVVKMYFQSSDETVAARWTPSGRIALWASAAGIIVLGIIPGTVFDLALKAF